MRMGVQRLFSILFLDLERITSDMAVLGFRYIPLYNHCVGYKLKEIGEKRKRCEIDGSAFRNTMGNVNAYDALV